MERKNKKQFKIVRVFKMMAGFMLAVVFLFGINFDILHIDYRNDHSSIGRILGGVDVLAADEELTPEEQKALEEKKKREEEAEKEAEEKQNKIKKIQKKVTKKEKEKDRYIQKSSIIKGNINKLAYSINSLHEKIKHTENEIKKIEEQITAKEKEIIKGRENMASIIRNMNRQKINLKITMLDEEKGLNDYIKSRDAMELLQKDILRQLMKLKENRKDLENRKKEASENKEILDDQKKDLQKEKVKKSWVLGATNKKISEQEAEIQQLKKEMAALQSAISSLLGKSYDTNDIKQAAKYASAKTGVRKAFILGMLTVETNLGRYTGGCTYKTSRMSSYRKTLFKKIAKETGHNYKKMKVSCPPRNYKGTGGAMGVAQFMSDTWMGYRSKIAIATGHKNPDPWNLTDGVMAMALKLANDGATKKSGECRAAMRYLGGSHKWYCEKVLNYAKQY